LEAEKKLEGERDLEAEKGVFEVGRLKEIWS
jgi:hypothetical protein